MSIQKKKGFTLIELMVVIVIIGILAAIAIPKLFGMTAKAKASEVGPAAGTWSKLQQAYVLDRDSLGSFTKIGYTPPGEKVEGGEGKESETGTFHYKGTPVGTNTTRDEATWEAKSIVKLGDCKEGATWSASIKMTGEGETGKPEGTVAGGGDDDADCQTLTPNFDKLQ
jgi:prepilin-type N-terminal cleavage/methylation domain-containing protein